MENGGTEFPSVFLRASAAGVPVVEKNKRCFLKEFPKLYVYIGNHLHLKLAQAKSNIVQTIKKYSKQLFGFIRQRVNSDEDAEDILQDVWYQLSSQPEVEAIEQVGSWLYRVARNRIVDGYRKQRPERLGDYGYEDEEGEIYFTDLLIADDGTPETEYLREIFWQQLMDALGELPENQRQVFVWNELEDETFQQISDRTSENIKTLISRKRYAVQHLRQRLESLYQDLVEN